MDSQKDSYDTKSNNWLSTTMVFAPSTKNLKKMATLFAWNLSTRLITKNHLHKHNYFNKTKKLSSGKQTKTLALRSEYVSLKKC